MLTFYKHLEQMLCCKFSFYNVSHNLLSPRISILFICCLHLISPCLCFSLPWCLSTMFMLSFAFSCVSCLSLVCESSLYFFTSHPLPCLFIYCRHTHTLTRTYIHCDNKDGLQAACVLIESGVHSHTVIKGCIDTGIVVIRIQQ